MAKPDTFAQDLTAIGNLALIGLGTDRSQLLTDLDTDTTDIAKTMRDVIYPVIRSLQTDYRMDELYTRVELTSPEDISEDDQYGWAYRYALPDDFLAPMIRNDYDFEIEGGYVYCDISETFIFPYQRYSIDPLEWSTQTTDMIVHKLKMELCMPLNENAAKYDRLLVEFENVIMPRSSRTASFNKQHPRKRRASHNFQSGRRYL